MFTQAKFASALQSLGVAEDRDLFETLAAMYDEPGRHYHDQSHVAECLTQFDRYRALAQKPGEIEVAIWFHDAIYDTRAPDNEEQSAALAQQHLARLNAAPDSITRVVDMILATKTHQAHTADSRLMLDIDLGILGTAPTVFEAYDINIRREYHWVAEDAYVAGRIQVLRSFLDRTIIYHTDTLRSRFESQARDNLARKISELSAGL